MLERAKAATRDQQETRIDYARFADDLVVLVGAHPRQRWLRTAVERRLREELARFLVEVNEEKSRRVDLTQDERFGFLGFEFRRIRTGRGRWMPLRTPQGKKRTALLQTLKAVFRSPRSRPVAEVIAQVNPVPGESLIWNDLVKLACVVRSLHPSYFQEHSGVLRASSRQSRASVGDGGALAIPDTPLRRSTPDRSFRAMTCGRALGSR